MEGSRGEVAMGSRGRWLGGDLPREGSGGRDKNTNVSVVVARRFPDGLLRPRASFRWSVGIKRVAGGGEGGRHGGGCKRALVVGCCTEVV